mmetsp:Transcript_22466/g.44139  ORF Transcript_22466/g.44139 Transcript_22466/m.44139 type:complete len:587 (+) Transcript_22466:153-1913(+)
MESDELNNSAREALLHDNLNRAEPCCEEEIDPLGSDEEGDAHIVASRAWNQQRSRKCLVCMTMGLVLSVALVIALPLAIDSIVRQGIRGNVVIDSAQADGFEQFRNISKTGLTYMEFYLFNITNPRGVLLGEKPRLDEIGPFVYETSQIREDFTWNVSEDTLSYRQHTYYVFDPAETLRRTKGRFATDDIEIITLNILFAAMEVVLGDFYWYEVATRFIYKNDFDRLFTRKSVHKLLTGYKDEIKLLGKHIDIKFPGLYPNVTKKEDPAFISKTTMRVGATNSSLVYELTVFDGMDSVKTDCPYGNNPLPGGHSCPADAPCCEPYSPFKTNSKVPVWGTEIVNGIWDSDANKVWGRVGEQFAPNLDPQEPLFIFNDLIKRTLKFECHNKESDVFKGIKMFRYRPVAELFYNASERPANARYYQFGPRGFLGNLSILEQGAPLQASLPHFYGGDESLIEGVQGLNPDRDRHSMYIDVEPILGQTMVEHVRAQVVGHIKRVDWPLHRDTWFPNIRDGTYVPIGWFDQVSEISNEGVSQFRLLYTAQDVQTGIYIAGSAVCLAFAFPLLNALRIHIFHTRHAHAHVVSP